MNRLNHISYSFKCFSVWVAVGVGCYPRRRVIHSDGLGQMRIYSPSVISALQNHLASTDPELGGPLENLVLKRSVKKNQPFPPLCQTSRYLQPASVLQDATAGRASSHWESRVLRGSIMAAALEDWTTVRIDPVTLAALQDTGWYTVNLSRAQSLVWGSGEALKSVNYLDKVR